VVVVYGTVLNVYVGERICVCDHQIINKFEFTIDQRAVGRQCANKSKYWTMKKI